MAPWNRWPGLPLLLEVVLWILFLPITLGLWIWESDWDLWLRLLLIIVLAVVTTSVMSPKPTMHRSDETRSADGDGQREIPPGAGAQQPR